MKKKIAIIGAGVGGLTLANLLSKDPNFELIIYEREEPVIDMFAIQSMLDSMNLTKRTREVLQVVNDLGSQEKASEHLGISQQAVSKHITIAKKEAERLYRL